MSLSLDILTKRTVEALRPDLRPWIAWDDRLTGFGVRIQPSGAKTFVVNYRTGSGGRSAPNKRVTLGCFGRITPDQARRTGTPRQGCLG
ncbi:MAG: Arm DNA-binding domain-containing protein [Deltaproteobacteria bacterium]|nr:Arm DNA-binding domain-containing protein [Deltaproteobacteria bacterium]